MGEKTELNNKNRFFQATEKAAAFAELPAKSKHEQAKEPPLFQPSLSTAKATFLKKNQQMLWKCRPNLYTAAS
jgi:hypothetical protein